MLRGILLIVVFLWMHVGVSYSQSFQFALVTDTHVGGSTGADDLRRTVQDLNQQTGIDFVILSGDLTEFGSDEELLLAKRILDGLKLPLYVLPGNHDSNWSESGANSFRKIIGPETFFLEHKGYQFVGTTSGPNIRMSPGQVPRENLVWLDSIFDVHSNKDIPLISINHYPLDESLNNWYELIDRVKSRNIQLALCGHGHQNKLYDWEGISGVMCRSNLRAKDSIGGYNMITIAQDTAYFQVRRPLLRTEDTWLKVALKKPSASTTPYPRPDYAVNGTYPGKVVWEYADHGDVGAGMATDGRLIFSVNTVGELYALDMKTGKKKWVFASQGKIYSTPDYGEGVVVFGSSDQHIYGVQAKTGKLLWKISTDQAVLGSPVIDHKKVYIGGSDEVFRCLDLFSGREIWAFDQVKGHVTTKPTIADGKVIFGSWKNGFYALDRETGRLVWEWNSGHANRMLSAAACYPVVAHDRVFIVAPDRYMTALDLNTGAEIWRTKKDEYRVREAIGLSVDGQYVYAKTMDGELIGVSTKQDSMSVEWVAKLQLPYEIAPTAIYSSADLIFVPSHSGLLSAVDPGSGEVRWQYKVSNGMINPPLIYKDRIAVSTMDGKIVLLSL